MKLEAQGVCKSVQEMVDVHRLMMRASMEQASLMGPCSWKRRPLFLMREIGLRDAYAAWLHKFLSSVLTLKSFTLSRGHIWRSSLHLHAQTLGAYTFITGASDRGIQILRGIWGASAVEKKKGMAWRLRSGAAVAQSKYGFFCLSLLSSNKAFKRLLFEAVRVERPLALKWQ